MEINLLAFGAYSGIDNFYRIVNLPCLCQLCSTSKYKSLCVFLFGLLMLQIGRWWFYCLQLLFLYHRAAHNCRIHARIQDHIAHEMAGSNDSGLGYRSSRADNRRDSGIGCLF